MILNRAKSELERLNADGRSLEVSKQALMRRRAKLFDDFTKESSNNFFNTYSRYPFFNGYNNKELTRVNFAV